uniref:Uncharacterized protein n=1 Tax=Haptolina brevifila TaxID=156173 RepID=A0A7S2JJJ8_9EUKA
MSEVGTLVSVKQSSSPSNRPGSPPGVYTSVAMETMQAMLANQREALEVEHKAALERVESELKADLVAAQEELADWKMQFAEAAGNTIQAVADARAETRSEVEHELEAESKAVMAMKAEADQAIELIRAAEATAAEANKQMETYKVRCENAIADAKAQTDKEAEAKLNVIMRNAALELRDKVKFVEQQTDATVKRAVDDAVRLAEAKAEVARKTAHREYELAIEHNKQQMSRVIGASTQQKISDIQGQQDARIEMAVKQALADAEAASSRQQAAAVEKAVQAAVAETEAQFLSRQTQLEQQLFTAKKEKDALLASMCSQDALRVHLAKAREEALKDKSAAIDAAVALAEKKAAIQQEKMAEGLSEKIQDAIKAREKQLLQDERRALKELAESELREQGTLVRYAGKVATDTWGSGNDEFEEEVLAKTQPTLLLGVNNAPAKPANKQKKKAMARAVEGQAPRSLRDLPRSVRHDDEESMVAPPIELVRLRARHAAEVESLLARQGADALMKPGPDEKALGSQGETKRQKKKRERERGDAQAAHGRSVGGWFSFSPRGTRTACPRGPIAPR